MAIWDTKHLALNYLDDTIYAGADTKQAAAAPHVTLMKLKAGTGDFATAFAEAGKAFDDVRWAIQYLIGNVAGQPQAHAVPNYLDLFTCGKQDGEEEFTLTWEKIVAAWADAGPLGKLWTVLSIDDMRKKVWNESVSYFALSAGKPET